MRARVEAKRIQGLYRFRRMLVIAACAAPVIVLGGVWLLVTQVLLAPGLPDGTTPPDRVAQFIMHEKGLPRMGREETAVFLEQQVRRLVEDDAFRDRFLAEYRVSSPEDQKAFREHLFDALKPAVMDDIRRYHELESEEQQAYLDGRIIAYNRMNAFWGDVRIGRADLGTAAPEPDELLQMLMQKTTSEERELGLGFAAALQARVVEILADPQLKSEFEVKIGGGQR